MNFLGANITNLKYAVDMHDALFFSMISEYQRHSPTS